MTLDELKEHCLKTLKQTEKFPTKTFEEHALVLQLIENQTSVIAEIEKIKTEIEDMGWDIYKTERKVPHKYVEKERIYELLDNHIKELKGENNG